LLPCVSWSASLFPDKYDKEFKNAAIHLPVGANWRLLKAQCYQESRLKPLAVSPVGAQGLCQFMPNTWRDMTRKYPQLSNPWLPTHSIRAAALYMKQLNRGWSSPRPQTERYKLALASYNAGFGNILAAQNKCGGAVLYQPIIHCLPRITGKHSKETIDYVKHIKRYYWLMVSTGN
jgi:membrane-bound lytic murein transglycosylase F